MNKKFLSAILFEALMVSSTGTFVSCKDYDDDIKDLQEQIDKQKTDLSDKVTAIESSIASLQTAQTGLEAKIAEVKDAAEKAALEAQKTAIAAAAEELAGVKAELEAAITKLQTATDEEIQAVKGDITEIEASIAEVNGKINALQAFQATTEETLAALAEADTKLAGTLTTLDAEVKANKVAIGKNEAAIDAQKKALEAYILSNDEAVAANKTAIEGILVTLGEQQEILDGLKAFDVKETQEAIATIKATLETMSTSLKGLSDQITAIDNKLEVLSAAIYKGVTHVALVEGNSVEGALDTELKLLSAEAVRTWTFGDKSWAGAIDFTKGERTTFEDKFVIRVSPTDAVVGKDNIKLINSTGADLSDLVVVEDVQKYKGTLTRGISETGLWEVTVKMNPEYKAEDFKAATQAKDENGNYMTSGEANVEPVYIAYAVSLNTTLDAEKGSYSRNVVSEYELKFTEAAQDNVRTLGFTVNATDVKDIHNRSEKSEETNVNTPTEYVWKTAEGTDFSEPIFDSKNEKCNVSAVVKDAEDWRQDKPILSVELKKAITVQLDEATMKAASAFYIVFDKDRAVSSDDSEIRAWEAAEEVTSGIKTVYSVAATKGKAEIVINDNSKDVYGFRVYAINHDGSLVDPDGRAFYVLTGDPADEIGKYNVEKTWTANGKPETKKVAVAADAFGDWFKNVETIGYVESKVDTVAYGSLETEVNSAKAFKIMYAATADAAADAWKELTAADASAVEGIDAANIKFITIDVVDNKVKDYWYDDDKTYSRTLEFKNGRGQVLKTLTVNFKKVLPTFPATFQAKVNQLTADGTLNAFMIPATATVGNPINGTKDLADSFNGLKLGEDSYDEHFIFTFAAASKVNDEVKDLEVSYNATNKYEFTVANKFIDNEKLHAVTVSYNFGEISSKAYGTKDGSDYKVKGGEFKNIIFSCLADINDYKWVTAPVLTYEDSDGTRTSFSNIKSINERDGKYSTTLDQLITTAKDNMIQGLDKATYELWSQVAKGGAIKEGSKNEYFIPSYAKEVTEVKDGDKVTTPAQPAGILFSKGSSKQNPEAIVYSTLIIKAKDYFGHEAVIKISDLEVKKR